VSVLERVEGKKRALTGGMAGRLYSLQGVVTVVGLYALLHIAARLIASHNLGEDDPLEAVLTQTLRLGYIPGQPPLYDWALWLIERVTGPGAVHFQLLKYGLLTATCAFIFAAARKVMRGDAFWAFLSVEALALIYQISWRFHEGFTHAVGAMCAVAATFWALLRLIERRGPWDYAILGLCAGLGVLTVNTFWVFLAALIMAACLQPAIRRVLTAPGALIALAVAAAVAAPYYLWLLQTPEGLAAMLPALRAESFAEYLRLALAGVRRAFTEPVMYLAPLIFIYPLFFRGWLWAAWRNLRIVPRPSSGPDYEQLLLHQAILCIAALIAGALLFGIHRYPVHALMPLFLVTSIWLTAQARNAAPDRRAVRRFVIMAASIAVFAFFARAANMFVLEPVCNICRWGVPYEELAQEMRHLGFERGRIVAADTELAGNLRRLFPDSRIELANDRTYAAKPPSATSGVKTIMLWPSDFRPEEAASRLGTLMPSISAADLAKAATIDIPWRGHLWKPDGYRHSSWRALLAE
jgi:hypothetical protein